jgi:hypothetical protein
VGSERRRQEDRRQANRSGKRDRRQNLCGNCDYFATQPSGEGWCQKHLKALEASDFACVFYQPQILAP